VLEWYDFAIYGYFASSIGRNFFAREDSVAQVLAAFSGFALGYLVRPGGGVLIGYIGDYRPRAE
jgi:MHS family proline/betaine transporter-like MFS transporter